MKTPHLVALLLLAALPVLAGLRLATADDAPAAGAPAGGTPAAGAPVVVELFTSQGCSSCPPADRLLARLAASGEGDVIPLSFHVDYWNYIGWTDPFSSSEWSKRQRGYAESLGAGRIYTPQAVINGRAECVGSNETRVREEIARAAREAADGRLTLSLRSGGDPRRLTLEIAARVERPAGERWAVMVAVFEDGLETPVARGENGGRTLRNSRVVRSLTEAFTLPARAGAERAAELEIALGEGWRRANLGVAAFLQDPASRRIHGAAVARLSV